MTPLGGYAAAALAALIWSSYPVATRAGVTGAFEPIELLLLRFGVGALLFLPYVVLHMRAVPREAWLFGVPLTLFQGAGMAALVIFGLQFAPASHAAALGPGVAPLWVVVLGYLVFSRRPTVRALGGALLCAAGVVLLTLRGMAGPDRTVLTGDLMFVAASGLGALYVLQLRKWGIGAIHGAAIVTLYSALIVVPWYLASSAGEGWRATPPELLWQIVWQGVLIGCVALIAFNHAIQRLGPERASSMIALVPVLSAVLGLLFLGEKPSGTEIAAFLAISAGVSIGASRPYAGSPAASKASAKRAAWGLSRPG